MSEFTTKIITANDDETIREFCERIYKTPRKPNELIKARFHRWEIFVDHSDSVDDIMNQYLKFLSATGEPTMEDKEPKLDIYNPEHYPDPTAYHGIKNAEREKRDNWISPEEFKELKDRHYKLIGCIFRICELSGFAVEERIVLRDKKTGKVWK